MFVTLVCKAGKVSIYQCTRAICSTWAAKILSSLKSITFFKVERIFSKNRVYSKESTEMYSSGEKLSLNFKNFQESLILSLGERRKDKEFADVTLVCEDGLQVEAHKVILAGHMNIWTRRCLLSKGRHKVLARQESI